MHGERHISKMICPHPLSHLTHLCRFLIILSKFYKNVYYVCVQIMSLQIGPQTWSSFPIYAYKRSRIPSVKDNSLSSSQADKQQKATDHDQDNPTN